MSLAGKAAEMSKKHGDKESKAAHDQIEAEVHLNFLLAEIEDRLHEPSDELVRETYAAIRSAIKEFDARESDTASCAKSSDETASHAGVTQIRRRSVSSQASRVTPPDESLDTDEFRAAAASAGSEKPRALADVPDRKILIGEAQGSKGKCSFYAIGDRVSVCFDGGKAPLQIFLRGLRNNPYRLSTEPDADGHYGIPEVKAADIAQFLALRRKPRW